MVLGIRYLVWCVGFVYMPVENVVGEILRSRNAVADKHNDRNMLLLETIEIENVVVGNKQTNMCKSGTQTNNRSLTLQTPEYKHGLHTQGQTLNQTICLDSLVFELYSALLS